MAGSSMTKIEDVKGTACVVRGDDIDTDRIIPARFMKVVTFDDMGNHLFEDARKAAKGDHPLDDEKFAGSSILVVGNNFGCGSSREHAPQALMRFGFRAFVGRSFAEIFFGNCTSLGLVCLTLGGDELENLMGGVELDPEQEIAIDVAAQTVTSRAGVMQGSIPEGTRNQLTQGRWDATSLLLDAGDAIERTAAKLSYVNGFQATSAS
jgi:3-isopropylmalate/(R)-2-methylmalate dehydratase small subunit